MDIATETSVPNGTGRRGHKPGVRHSPETRKKMSAARLAYVARKKAEKEARAEDISRKRSEAAKRRWAKTKDQPEAPTDAELDAIESITSDWSFFFNEPPTAEPRTAVYVPTTELLANIATADLLAELGRRANP
jgi:hypothetical protein